MTDYENNGESPASKRQKLEQAAINHEIEMIVKKRLATPSANEDAITVLWTPEENGLPQLLGNNADKWRSDLQDHFARQSPETIEELVTQYNRYKNNIAQQSTQNSPPIASGERHNEGHAR